MCTSRRSRFACASALLLFSALPAAGMCSDPCRVFILPDSTEAPLPLDDWMVPAGTPAGSIQVIEPPHYGAFSIATQAYVPSSDFWRLGLDRLVIQAPGLDPKAVLLIVASPDLELLASEDFDGNAIGTWTYSGASSFSFSAERGYALSFGGAEGEISTPLPVGDGARIVSAGAGVTASPGAVPCPSGCLGAQEPIVLQAIQGLFQIDLKVVGSTYYVRAQAIHPAFQCGDSANCATPFVPLSKDGSTRLEASLGASSYFGPANSTFSLRFDVTPEHGDVTQRYEVGNWMPVSLEGTHQLTSGLIGAAAPHYGFEIQDLRAWVLRQGDDPTRVRSDRFEGHSGYEEAWTQMGSVNLVRQANSRWLSADLAGLKPSLTSRSSLMDEQVGSRGRMRLTFTLDISALALERTDNLMVFAAQGDSVAGTNRIFDLLVGRVAGVYSIRARAVSDDGSVTATDWLRLEPGGPTAVAGTPNTITAQFQAGAGNGSLRLQANRSYAEANGLSNGSQRIESVSFGASTVHVALPTSTRTLRIDNVATVY